MRRRVRLTEGDLHRIVKESVKGVINEYQGKFSNTPIPHRVYDGQLTAKELIDVLQEFDPNRRVEVYVGNRTFRCISDAQPETNSLFLSGDDYDEWKNNSTSTVGPTPHDDYGEGFEYLSNPSSLPAGWQ